MELLVRVLVGCEFSGVVRDAFRERGHDAWSCDLLPSERPGPHIQGDVLEHLNDGWDIGVFHPSCQFLSRAGSRWNSPERERLAEEARDFVLTLWAAPIPRVCIENPIGKLNRLWRYPDQTIEPWFFGDPYTKRTCLWMRGLPPLMATVLTPGGPSWISSGALTRVSRRPRKDGAARTARERSRTFPGIAEAMADQWGALLPVERVA